MFDRIFIGTIVMSAPETGCCVVTENGKSQALANTHIGLLPFSDAASGSAPYAAYIAGATVVCCNLYGAANRVVAVLGLLNANMDLLGNSYAHRRLYNASRCAQSYKEMLSNWKLLSKLLPGPLASFLKSHANAVDGDVLPGDYDIQDKYSSAGLHAGMLVAGLRGSALAMTDVTVPDSKVRRYGDVLSDNTIAHEAVAAYDYTVSNTAVNASEAFGLKKGPVMKKEGDNLVPVNDAAIPFYRMQHMEGAPVGGVEDTILDFPKDKTEHLPDADSEPSILSLQRRGLSGSMTSASTLSIASIKTPGIIGALQLGYGKKPLQPGVKPSSDGYNLEDMKNMDDLREPYEEAQTEVELPEANASDEDKVTDAALNKLMDTLLEGEYRQKILDIMAARGFSKATKEHTVKARMKKTAKGDGTPGGTTSDQAYGLPDYVDIEDPVTGQKRRYYNTMSFITQESDGSICISDGYGSEIRMCRGNIYISSALDTFIRPGRHFSCMTPGVQSFNSQGRCDISSGQDTVSIRAVKDLCMAAGASDADDASGKITLENLSKQGGDILITGNGNTEVTAGMGLVLGTRIGSASCNITIDAGLKGALYTRSRQTTIDSAESVIGGFDGVGRGAKGTALVVNASAISLLAQRVNIPAVVDMQKTGDTHTVMVVRDDLAVAASISVSGTPSLYVGDMIYVDKGLHTNGQVYAYSLAAVGLSAPMPERYFTKWHTSDNRSCPKQAGATSANAGAAQNVSVHSYKYLEDNTFKYPESYGVQMPVVPGMRWQEASKDSSSPGDVWTEPMVNNTYIYPGKDVWDKANVSSRGYNKSAMLKDGYRTNMKLKGTEKNA